VVVVKLFSSSSLNSSPLPITIEPLFLIFLLITAFAGFEGFITKGGDDDDEVGEVDVEVGEVEAEVGEVDIEEEGVVGTTSSCFSSSCFSFNSLKCS
jgi:hypothetical protein